MKGKYEEIMDRIEVTEDMRSRILENIKTETSKSKPGNIIRNVNWKRYSAVAAVVAVVLVGAYAFQQINTSPQNQTSQEVASEAANVEENVTDIYQDSAGLATDSGFVELDSLQELEDAVGFSMVELENLPFEATEITYVPYGDETAEIHYQNDERQIIYTKTRILGENNGHYETYETEKTVNYQGLDVTMKENPEGAYILVWQEDDFEYMIYSDLAMTEDDLLALIP